MGNWKHFQEGEVAGLDTELIAMLDMAREKAGVPFLITSGKRTPDQNAGLSGTVKDSAHLTGNAVDLAVNEDHAMNRMLYGLYAAGFGRFGLYFRLDGSKLIPAHIHVDNAKDKPLEVTWSLIEAN